MHLCKRTVVADLVKHAPPYMCYHAECRQDNPKIGKRWNSALGMTPKYMPLPDTCYHVKFGSSATKRVCTNRMEPRKLGSAGTPPP